MPDVKVTYDGKSLQEFLKHWNKQAQEEIVNKGLRMAARVVTEAARQNIDNNGSNRTGRLRKSIRVRKGRGKLAKFGQFVAVEPNYSGRNGAPNAHVVEFGTGPRKTNKDVNRGAVAAKPFMRPAYESTKGQVQQILKDHVMKAYEKSMARKSK